MKLKNIRIDDLCGFAVTDSENPRFTLETENELENAFISSYSLKVKSDEAVLWQTEEQSSTVDNIVYGGRALLPCTVYTVEATVCDNYGNKAEKTAEFETGFLSGDFSAEWITKPNYHVGFRKSPIPLVFKRQFLLSGKVKKARLYSTAFGIYSFTLCGKEISDDRFAPGFTSFEDRLQYQVYDIAPFLEEKNELVFTVAGGWAVGIFGLNRSNKLGADRLALKALVQIEYDDGRKDEIKTDESWLVTADGPVRDVSFYNGEIFDATKTLSKAIFENAEKEKPRISPRLVASYGKFAKIIETLEPKEIQKSQNGYIYDFGQNCGQRCTQIAGCLDDILIQFHHRIVYRQNHKRQIIINHANNNRHIGIRQILSRQPQYPKDCINNSVSGQQQLPGHNTQYKVYPHRKNHDNSHQSFFSDVQFPQYHSQRIGQQKTDHCTQ